MNTSGVNQGFEWTIINLSTSSGNVNISDSAGHNYIGNRTCTTNASCRFMTVLTAANTATTYRIAN
jgi:glyceraldehyde-3-phosphate dehydrogenase/erythrose-4-phosphate dehydrogenase